MNILLVSSKYQPEYSGSGLRAHNTYKRLKKKYNVNYDILSNSILYHGNKEYKFDGVEITRISSPFKISSKKSIWRFVVIFFGFIWEIFYSWRFIRKNINNYDLLHTFGNTWTIGFLTWYFAKKNKPVIRELCNEMNNPFYPIQFQNFMKFIFKKNNTLVVAISKKLENLAINFKVKNIWCRLNPVDENRFFVDYKSKYSFRSKLSKFNQKDVVLTSVANFIDNKNQLFILDVLSLLPGNFKLILAGPLKPENKDYFYQLQKKIESLRLNDRVDLKSGFVDNFDEYLKCSDIFLFPSKSEGLGTPILESQVCGIPVISNYIKDVTDTIIQKNKGGYFLELNQKEWAERIQKVMKITEVELVKNANYISNISSSKLIDREYYNLISKLLSNKFE